MANCFPRAAVIGVAFQSRSWKHESLFLSPLFCFTLFRVMLGLLWGNYMEMTSAKPPSLALKP